MRLIPANMLTRYGTHGATGKYPKAMFEMDETDDRDVKCEADGGIVFANEGSQGIRVKITSLPTEQG